MAAPAPELAEACDLINMLAERATPKAWHAVVMTLRVHMFQVRCDEMRAEFATLRDGGA
jgi:hypothetical protein